MGGGADEQIVEGVVPVRSHNDIGGIGFFDCIEDLDYGRSVDQLRLDGKIRMTYTETLGDFGQTFDRVFFANVDGLLEIFQGETIIARQYRGLDDVEQDNAALGRPGERSGDLDHTLRGGRKIDRGKDRFHNVLRLIRWKEVREEVFF